MLAYNLLLLSGFALSGAAMFLLVRSLTGSVPARCSSRVRLRVPAVSLHALRASRAADGAVDAALPLGAPPHHHASGRLRDGLLTGLFLALQMLSSWYYGIFFATYLVPVAAVLLIA